jgi:hypothetical protein
MKFPQKAIDRFNVKVNKTNDCHVWNNGCVNPEHLELQTKSQNKKSYSSVRISKEMVERESIKYLFRLRNIRPELEKEIDALLLLLNTEIIKEQDDFGFESESKKKEYL